MPGIQQPIEYDELLILIMFYMVNLFRIYLKFTIVVKHCHSNGLSKSKTCTNATIAMMSCIMCTGIVKSLKNLYPNKIHIQLSYVTNEKTHAIM